MQLDPLTTGQFLAIIIGNVLLLGPALLALAVVLVICCVPGYEWDDA